MKASDSGDLSTASRPPLPRRLILCLDGTRNSAYVRQYRSDGHGVIKPSNVLKLCRSVPPIAADLTSQIVYYDIGVGSLAKYPGVSNRLLAVADSMLGGGFGAGFEGNIEDALLFLANNYVANDEVFVFGFSRGAATARGLTHILDWCGGIPERADVYYLPRLFREFVRSRGHRCCKDVVAEIDRERATESTRRDPIHPFRPVSITFLGVWDTVLALGSRFRATGVATSVSSRSFYLNSTPATCVVCARQALAIDEQRFDFRPEMWTSAAAGQSLEQRWFAGVHSNVGGGYVDDGLSNVAFHWIVREAANHGLDVDAAFAAHFRAFAQDRLYRSESWFYRALDAGRLRVGRGRRPLLALPVQGQFSLDRSVIHRLCADPTKFPDMRGRRYRPLNLLRLLASQPDLNAFLQRLGFAAGATVLPPDVQQSIAALRSPSTPWPWRRVAVVTVAVAVVGFVLWRLG